MHRIGFAMMSLLVACYSAYGAVAPVPQTGETTCWQMGGAQIPCAGTGQDGDWQAGVEAPSMRFTDLNNGAVRDNLTRLIWLKDARCPADPSSPYVPWAQALAFANALAHGACGLTDGSVPGDWRMPNVREMLSLIDYGQFSPALPAGHPFLHVPVEGVDGNPRYWTSTTRLAIAVQGFAEPFGVNIEEGWTFDTGLAFVRYLLWPVRGGR